MHFINLPWQSVFQSWTRDSRIDSFVIWGKTEDDSFARIQEISIDSTDQFPTLALANVDDDSLVVKYSHHELVFSDPKILTIMASPPYFEGIGMDISNSETTYSLNSETTYTNTGQVGFYLKGAIGGCGSWGIKETGAEWGFYAGWSLSTEFSWGWGLSQTRGTDLTYTVDAGYDQVIFAGIPIDMYVYDILSAPDGFVEENGPYFTISVPREAQTNSVEVVFYNDTVNEAQKIPDEILNHTIGDPHSYYSATDKADLEAEATAAGEQWLSPFVKVVVT